MKNPVLPFATLLLLLGALFTACPANAQDSSDNQEETVAELEQMLMEFAEAYESLPETKNKQAVLDYFHPDATSNMYVFNISGRSRVSNNTIRGFEAYMDNLLRSPNLATVYEVTEVVDIKPTGNVATIVYRVKYELKEEDGIWVKGNELVTLALEKHQDKWLIVHYTIVQVEDEKLKGTCLCELFIGEGDDAEVVSKTIVPSGRNYSTKFNNFEFRTLDNGDWGIKVEGNTFKRLTSGELISINEDGDETELGIPSGKKEAVLMILRESLYKDSCARIRVP